MYSFQLNKLRFYFLFSVQYSIRFGLSVYPLRHHYPGYRVSIVLEVKSDIYSL